MKLDQITAGVLEAIDGQGFVQKGAYNLRQNGQAVCHGDSENVRIVKKQDKPLGLISLSAGRQKVRRCIYRWLFLLPGITDVVYNDFYIEDGADVLIVAGCGIHNDGDEESRHDGIHAFHVGSHANVRYEERHYGEGKGTGGRVLNPVTKIYVEEDSVFTLDTTQIKGVDSTIRETHVEMGAGSKLYVMEKLMTHGNQQAISNMDVQLNGEESSAQIISRLSPKTHLPRSFIRKPSEMRCATHTCSVILLSWMMQRSVLFLRSTQTMWMPRLYTRQPSGVSIMISSSNCALLE